MISTAVFFLFLTVYLKLISIHDDHNIAAVSTNTVVIHCINHTDIDDVLEPKKARAW